MIIRKFVEQDRRTAMAKVRDELGAEAFVLSSRVLDDGFFEMVAAKDYDANEVIKTAESSASGLREQSRQPSATSSGVWEDSSASIDVHYSTEGLALDHLSQELEETRQAARTAEENLISIVPDRTIKSTSEPKFARAGFSPVEPINLVKDSDTQRMLRAGENRQITASTEMTIEDGYESLTELAKSPLSPQDLVRDPKVRDVKQQIINDHARNMFPSKTSEDEELSLESLKSELASLKELVRKGLKDMSAEPTQSMTDAYRHG